ncbi:MAG: flagellar motor protein MotB [Massilia sp.]|nr:flagellar motor protein MotB [Massilia sp.]
MNNSKKIALAAAILCSAGTSLAQEINPSWYIQPNAVGVKVDREFGLDERDWGGGLKIGKPLSRSWDVQVGASHVRAEDGPARYNQTLLGADALLMLSRQRFRPFLLFGVGLQRDKVENPLHHGSATNPYVTAGLGLQYGLNEQWSLQADIRTVRGYIGRDDNLGPRRSNNKYLTLGVNYAFTKPAPPPPPPPPPPPAAVVVVEQVPTPPPPPPPPPPRFEKVTLSATELFDFNSATLKMPQPKLDDIAAALIADPTITDVQITGYADRLGSAKYNLKLSQRRANAVRDYLIAKGVDASRLKAVGKGKANPVVQCHQKKRAELIECLAPNRRVEVEQITVERRVQ